MPIHAGDRLRLVDVEGMQRCELVAADAAGAIDPAILGARGDGDARGLKQILSGDERKRACRPRRARAARHRSRQRPRRHAVRRRVPRGRCSRIYRLARWTVDRGRARRADGGRRAGYGDADPPAHPARAHSPAERDAAARASRRSAAGHPRQPGDGRGLFRARRRIHPDHRRRRPAMHRLPVLLRAQARQGRRASARRHHDALADGAGLSAPGPAAPKAFDQDMEPLVEVVRDTVGRHDAFALACNARFYEDQGYPGHVNCTDNFNTQLAPYGIAARKGWMALNFFYNTGIDANNVLYFDEPWSRPGDYVLLRALTDLVCVSSACPDDIDPANGWNPTDIHVRTYSDKQSFSRASGLPHDARRRAAADARDRVPSALLGADAQLHRISRLLAAEPIQQRRAGRRILGLPRARGDHGPVAAAQIRGDRPRRRGAAAIRADPQRAEARRRPGGLYRHVLRAWRHDRRRHAVPARRQQFPLDRRRRLRRHLAARAGREAGLEGLGALLHRPAAQRRRARAEEPRHPAAR